MRLKYGDSDVMFVLGLTVNAPDCYSELTYAKHVLLKLES